VRDVAANVALLLWFGARLHDALARGAVEGFGVSGAVLCLALRMNPSWKFGVRHGTFGFENASIAVDGNVGGEG